MQNLAGSCLGRLRSCGWCWTEKNICQIVMQPDRQVFNHFCISGYTSVVLLTQHLVQKPQRASVFAPVILTAENMLHDNLPSLKAQCCMLIIYDWLGRAAITSQNVKML